MTLRKTAAFAVFASLFCAGFASAGVIRHDVADASYLALGNDPDYDSVGRVTYSVGSGSGSGVLIGQDWYLTAGHVVYSNYLNNTPGNVQFTVGGNTYVADQIVLHPGYVNNLSENGNDLALVRLSSVVSNVTPASLYTSGGEIGQTATIVGFGRTGTGLTGATVGTNVKRAGTNVLDTTGDTFASGWSSNVALSDFDYPGQPYSTWGSSTPTALEYLVAEGDSGGGVFVDFGSGPVLAAISSFLLSNNDGVFPGYGDGMGATRLSGHAAWIAETLAVPEPSTLVLAIVGLLAIGAVHRGRKHRG